MIISKVDFSTVLVVGAKKETKSLRIKTKHINRVKQYIVGICLTFCILIGMTIFLSLQINKNEKEKLAYMREITHLKKQIPEPLDTLQARNYIQSIESKLKQINKYLMKRGIKGFTVDNVGGSDESATDLSPKEIYSLYDERLKDVLIGVAFTPLGYPGNVAVNSGFGYRDDPMRGGRAEFHPGIDFRGKKGDIVKSTADGKVVVAGWTNGYGNCVRIKHKNNLETLYGHLSKISVKVGQMVVTGQTVGQVGSTGHSTGSHLHYEVRRNGKPINPNNFLNFN